MVSGGLQGTAHLPFSFLTALIARGMFPLKLSG
jgi:hypothetical protein